MIIQDIKRYMILKWILLTYFMYKRGKWRVWQTGCTTLRSQTTADNELYEGRKTSDTAITGIIILNYRLENFVMTQCRPIIHLVI
jgi:hypothetical protein